MKMTVFHKMICCRHLCFTFVFVIGLIAIVASGGGDGDDSSGTADDAGNGYLPYDAATVPKVTSFSDAAFDLDNATYITLNGTYITVSGPGATVSGSVVTITASGTYNITGALTNGQVKVDVTDTDTDTGDVRFYLNGVNITSSSASPVDIESAARVIVVLAPGSNNYMTDVTTNMSVDEDGEAIDAAFFSKDDLVIYGGGSLTVDANYKDGIKCKDGLIIAGGTIYVTSADDGIIGKNFVSVQDGYINVNAGGDGLKSTNEGTDTQGYVVVKDGDIQIEAGADAIQAETHIAVKGGTFDLTTGMGSGNPIPDSDTTTSAKGLKANVGITIDGGDFAVDSADDSFNSDDTIIIGGGAFSIASGDDGMHAELALTIDDGQIDVSGCYEGIESLVITINDGEIHILSDDDPINATDGSGAMFSAVGFLYINGGYIAVNCRNADGLDSNGTIVMKGGLVIVNGPVQGGNGILDYGTFTLTGGFIIGAGTSDMAQAPGGGASTQNSLLLTFNQQTAVTLFHLETGGGEEMVTFAPAKAYASIVFSSPPPAELENGATYKVYFGGTYDGGTVLDGLYSGGTYGGGTENTALGFTVSSLVTTIRTGSGGGGRGNMLP